MNRVDPVAEWKSHAWETHDFAVAYAAQMHAQTNVLRNAVERDILHCYTRGTALLDVGIGSGRASLPFAREGRQVTGVDVSEAMLELCRVEAGNLDVRILRADLQALPFAAETFDTVMALNVMVHRPDWQSVLAEWVRVVRPGGRIVFDVQSLDHLAAAALPDPRYREEALAMMNPDDPVSYCAHASSAEIVGAANELDLAVEALVPYGALDDRNFWMRSDENDDLWDRMLGWCAACKDVFELCFFLERSVCAALPPTVSGRMMVVLERRLGARANEAFLTALRDRSQRLLSGSLRDGLDEPARTAATWRDSLSEHMKSPRNRVLLYKLLARCVPNAPFGGLTELLSSGAREQIASYARSEALDDSGVALVRAWPEAAGVDELLTYRGVALAPALQYGSCQRLMRALRERAR